MTADEYQEAVGALKGTQADAQAIETREWFAAAQRVAGEQGHRFFHWELEFPECFFDMRRGKADWKPEEERGFDAVIGNPPWGCSGCLVRVLRKRHAREWQRSTGRLRAVS